MDDHSGSDVDTSTASEESSGHAWTVVTSPSARAAARAKAEWNAGAATRQEPKEGGSPHAPGRVEPQGGGPPEQQRAPEAAAQPPPQGAALSACGAGDNNPWCTSLLWQRVHPRACCGGELLRTCCVICACRRCR